MNRSRDIGTRAETAVVRYARPRGFPYADRLALRGGDVGDVRLTAHLTAGVVVEVKAGKQADRAAPADVLRWRHEAAVEGRRAGADVSLLVLVRGGYGPDRAGRWFALWSYGDLVGGGALREDPSVGPRTWAAMRDVECRTTLDDALVLLRLRGYGDPVDPADLPLPSPWGIAGAEDGAP